MTHSEARDGRCRIPGARTCGRVDGAQMLREDLLDRLSHLVADMVYLTEDLVRVPTENPPGLQYDECIAVILRWLTTLGLPSELVSLSGDSQPSRSAVVSEIGSGPAIYLHGHYDVVPAQSREQFEPRRSEHRVYGRGAADMKSGLAAMIFAVAALRPALEVGRGRVVLNLVPDEETGGAQGSAALLAARPPSAESLGAILAEPTSGVVWNGSRGAITLRIRTGGKGAHVGLQHEGENAFEAAVPVVAQLMALKAEVEQRRTALNITPDAARHSILMLGGEVTGGTHFNVVPDQFAFTVERRFNPEEELEEERARILELVSEHGAGTAVEVIQEAESSRTSEESEFCRAVGESVTEVTGEVPRFEMCPGLLETRFYTRVGVPAVAYGPGLLSVSHGPDEYVEIQRIVECAKVYASTVLKLL